MKVTYSATYEFDNLPPVTHRGTVEAGSEATCVARATREAKKALRPVRWTVHGRGAAGSGIGVGLAMSGYPGWREWTPRAPIDSRLAVGEIPGHTLRPSKYRAEPQMYQGQRFDSKRELRRFHELVILGRVGRICDLELHPGFPLFVNGVRVGVYHADFRYRDMLEWALGRPCDIIEDVKSPSTRKETAYRLRKKLFEALYAPLVVTEV